MNPILSTKLKIGIFNLYSESDFFIFKINSNTIFKMNAKEYLLQDAYRKYSNILKDFQKDNIVISSTVESGLGYISLKLDEKSQNLIYQAIKDFADSSFIKKEDYHVTLMCDRSNPILIPNEIDRNVKFKAKANGILFLHQNEQVAIGISLESEDIKNRLEEFQNIGLKHYFDIFIPHCTIKYNIKESEIKKFEKFSKEKKKIIEQIGEITLIEERWQEALIF